MKVKMLAGQALPIKLHKMKQLGEITAPASVNGQPSTRFSHEYCSQDRHMTDSLQERGHNHLAMKFK
jgi:hypothetical protein